MMTPRLRLFALTAHIMSTVGWLGAVVGFVALAVAALASQDVQLVRGAYLAMELIGLYVLVPLCLASLVTGLIMSLATAWGLFRHYWVLAKLLITIVAALVLFLYLQTLSQLGDQARDPSLSLDELHNFSPLLHAGGALAALLATTVLSVYKPRGLTEYGERKEAERHAASQPVEEAIPAPPATPIRR